MITTITECARGCRVAIDAEGNSAPAVALTGGILCPVCVARIGWNLDEAADVAARARLAVAPGIGAGGGEKVSGTKDPGMPLNIVAMDACDQLVAMLGDWLTYWAREISVRPPAALVGALHSDRNVEGVRVAATPEAVADGLREWAEWIKAQMHQIQARPAVVAFHDELSVLVGKIGRQFPRDSERKVGQQKPRYCPVCEMQRVWVTWSGPEPVVQCGSCLWEFETEWKELLSAIGISGGGT